MLMFCRGHTSLEVVAKGSNDTISHCRIAYDPIYNRAAVASVSQWHPQAIPGGITTVWDLRTRESAIVDAVLPYTVAAFCFGGGALSACSLFYGFRDFGVNAEYGVARVDF
jgi:hypothetical protein